MLNLNIQYSEYNKIKGNKMINIITNAELDVVDKQKQLVAEALGPDSAFIDHTTTIRGISVNFKTTLI